MGLLDMNSTGREPLKVEDYTEGGGRTIETEVVNLRRPRKVGQHSTQNPQRSKLKSESSNRSGQAVTTQHTTTLSIEGMREKPDLSDSETIAFEEPSKQDLQRAKIAQYHH